MEGHTMGTPSLLLTLLEGDVNVPDPLGAKIREVVDAIKNKQDDPLLGNAQNELYSDLRAILANQMQNPDLNRAIGKALESALSGTQLAADDPDIKALRQKLTK